MSYLPRAAKAMVAQMPDPGEHRAHGSGSLGAHAIHGNGCGGGGGHFSLS
jgi:hypothetical protein